MLVMVALLAAMSSASCLEDLPEPLVCPPPARNAATDCLPAASNPVGMNGCFIEQDLACLRGGTPPASCDCASNECPQEGDTCFPPGECPEAVRVAAGDEASCDRLTGSDIGRGLPGDTQCLCGCTRCATVCDGYGTIYATFGPEGVAKNFIVALTDMPDAGQLGIYYRLRGIANMVTYVIRGPIEMFDIVGTYGTFEVSGDFVEQILYDVPVTSTPPYTWTQAADKPTALVVAPLEIEQDTGFLAAITEIDCIIPFSVPL
jgi:hypothetical protein